MAVYGLITDNWRIRSEPLTVANSYLSRFFAFDYVRPLAAVVVSSDIEPATYYPETATITISRYISEHHKLLRITLLHELIHHTLYCENGDPDKGEGQRFQAHLRRLFEDAYLRLKLL